MPAALLDPAQSKAGAAHLRLSVEDLSPELRVGLVLDGSAQYGLLRRYGFSAFALLGLSALLAMAIGALIGNRVSGVLRQVAASVRDLDSPLDRTVLEVAGAPNEIREVTDAFQETLEKIRRQSERTRLLTAGLAHELRSPIQNLLGETEVALMREREPEEYRRVLGSTIEELRDLARVVDNLVLLCSAGESDGAAERFDLGLEAELRLQKETQRANERGVHVDFEHRGDLEVRGDREALVLALRNLLSNAVRWSPVGGNVRVTLAGSPERVEIVVDDDGPGVDEAERAKIFEPFYRGRPGAGERAGYGLGLALARAGGAGPRGLDRRGTRAVGRRALPDGPPRAGSAASPCRASGAARRRRRTARLPERSVPLSAARSTRRPGAASRRRSAVRPSRRAWDRGCSDWRSSCRTSP